MEIELPWGRHGLVIQLPDSWRLLGSLQPRPWPIKETPAQACAAALQAPLGARRLADRDLQGRRVLLVVDDHSRPTPVAEFIGPVLEELARAGVRFEDLEVLIATGVHRPSRLEEVGLKLGPELAGRLRWRCHAAYDPQSLADLGRTSRGTPVFLNTLLTQADLILTLGAIEPHLLLGFGGGLKMIIPGCAGAQTIAANHLQGVDPDHFDFVGALAQDSPMRLDLEEGVGRLGREIFMVNAAMNEEARPTRFFCGDPLAAHRAGVEFVSNLTRLEVPCQADVVLTNSYPMDLDLRQSAKCLGNSLDAVRPGGVILGCLYCREGLGEMPLAPFTLPYSVMRTLLKVIGKNRVLPLVRKIKKGQPEEEVFIGHFALQMLRRNHLGLFTPSPRLPPEIGRKMGVARSFTQIGDLVKWATGKAPRQATVWVFPQGGVSYAAHVPG